MDLAGCICIHICIYVATILKEEVVGLIVGVGGTTTQEELDRKEGGRSDETTVLM